MSNVLDDNPASSSPGPNRGGRVNGAPASRWTFLTNHAHVLIRLHANSDSVLREVAAAVGITERAVQRIVQELEEEGFVERERVGRRNRYRVLTDNHLRHPIEAHCKIAEFLDLIVAGDDPAERN